MMTEYDCSVSCVLVCTRVYSCVVVGCMAARTGMQGKDKQEREGCGLMINQVEYRQDDMI